MNETRQNRLTSLLKRQTAEFLQRHLPVGRFGAKTNFVLTVNYVTITPNGRKATIYLTVFPGEFETIGLRAAQAASTTLRSFFAANLKLKQTPFLVMAIAEKEKKRQTKDTA